MEATTEEIAMSEAPKKSIPATVFAIIAILAGLNAFTQGLMLGRRAGYEMMMIYAAPAVVAAIIAIAIRRNALSWVALAAGGLAIVGTVLGS